jgi:hypothetical protein
MSQSARYARLISDVPVIAARKMRAGEICRSCKSPLPSPHLPTLKLCDFCADKHLVFMYFRRRCVWYCAFRNESRNKLPRELTFKSSASVREIAKRGNGLVDEWDRQGFDIDLELGRGGLWLRLTDKQYLALGGVL